MNDVIHILSSPATREPSQARVDLGVVEITDSEPEGDDLIWTRRVQETAQPDSPSHQRKESLKEDSPMDVEIPISQPGPSRSPAPDPFPDAPTVHIQPDADPQEAAEDPHTKHLALVLEFIPDVSPQYALELIEKHRPVYGDQVGEWVVQSLFEDSSHPKAEKGVAGERKGKRKASELEDAVEEPPSKVKVDFTSVNRPKPTGKNYRKMALVS